MRAETFYPWALALLVLIYIQLVVVGLNLQSIWKILNSFTISI